MPSERGRPLMPVRSAMRGARGVKRHVAFSVVITVLIIIKCDCPYQFEHIRVRLVKASARDPSYSIFILCWKRPCVRRAPERHDEGPHGQLWTSCKHTTALGRDSVGLGLAISTSWSLIALLLCKHPFSQCEGDVRHEARQEK